MHPGHGRVHVRYDYGHGSQSWVRRDYARVLHHHRRGCDYSEVEDSSAIATIPMTMARKQCHAKDIQYDARACDDDKLP